MSDPSFTVEGGAMRYLDALRRHWLLIATLCVLAVAAAAVSTYTATKRYTTTADLALRPLSANDTTFQGFTSLFQQPADASVPVVTAARLIKSPAIRTPCIRAMPRSARSAKISISPLSQADVIEIHADGPSPSGTATAANSFASCTITNRNTAFKDELTARLNQLRARIAAIPASARQGNFEYAALQQQFAGFTSSLGTPNPTISLLSGAAVPTSPVWPRPKIALAASLLVALLLGVGIALLLEFVTPRIGNEDDLRIRQRLPILARIPRLSRSAARAYITGKSPLPPQAWKSYRVLRAVLANSGRTGGYPRSIMVTSAMPGDGKTTSAINLALTLARSDLHVVLIDADVHRPMVATFFNVAANRNGFGRLSSGSDNLRELLVDAPLDPNLKLILAAPEAGAYVGLTEDRARGMIEKVLQIADIVVIDCPPLTEVAEVLEVASAAEVIVLAVRLGRTRRDKLEEARELLAQRGVSPAGFIVTTRDRVERETHYDYPGEPVRPTHRLGAVPDVEEAAKASRR